VTSGSAGVPAGHGALHSRHRPPRDCPVCGNELDVTELSCPGCGSRLSGSFAPCRFCALSAADAEVVEVFLRSRGNMREVERHLGVSYPTARQRFTELLGRLGYPEAADPPAEDGPVDRRQPGEPRPGSGEGPGAGTATQGPAPTKADVRQQVLSRLAAGDLTAEQAAVLLRGR
jgi:hypothetical protein